MEWMNIHTSTIDSEAYLDAVPVQRATWLNLLRFCCGQENGGRVAGAATFNDRKWQQLAGVTHDEVHSVCRLWRFDSNDLLVEFYNSETELMVKRNRKNGSIGGRARASSALRMRVQAQIQAGVQASASSGAMDTASRKGKERKGKEIILVEEEGASQGSGEGNPPAATPSVLASRSKFAALSARVRDASARADLGELTADELLVLKKMRADLADLQKRQAAGDFTP